MPTTEIADDLNKQQARAVSHGVVGKGANVTGPVLVIAGAGTGKTKTLVHRAAHLINNGADPNRIMLLTFTRQAAGEMTGRVKRLLQTSKALGAATATVPWSGTFHAIGSRLLRTYAKRIGLTADFTVHDRADAEDLMEMLRHDLGFTDKGSKFPAKGTCLAIYSRTVNAQLDLETVLNTSCPDHLRYRRELGKLMRAYVAAKQKQHVLDFDDLLLYWDELLKNPQLARQIGGRFDHILVDEFQDTNALQGSILRRMKPDGAGLTVVGDDAQAIYGFRAADVRNILDFPEQFDPPATVRKLERNYRSTPQILAASTAVIELASEGFRKTLRAARKGGAKPRLVTIDDDMSQAAFVAGEILDKVQRGKAYNQHAVLFRSSYQSFALELELARRGIPFQKFGGRTFTEAAHVKDVLGVLKWAENPDDRVTALRVITLLPGIGPKTALKLLDATNEFHIDIDVPAKSAVAWRTLAKLMQRLRCGTLGWPRELEAVRAWYRPFLESQYSEDHHERAADLEQLQVMGEAFKSRRNLLTDMTLDPPSKSEKGRAKPGTDTVTLSTIHSCKGREWRTVFVLHVVDGCLPSSRAHAATEIEEERRLLYVAMTRAKRELTVMVPWRVGIGGAPSGDMRAATQRSSFIPDAILSHFEVQSADV
jgi:ATP-dependent DNA helicase UvrD/PcrA